MKNGLSIALVLLASAGCSNAAERDDDGFGRTTTVQTRVALAQSFPGFRMLPQRTHFPLEKAVQEETSGMTKLTAANGVFAVLRSGMTFGTPNSDAPSRAKPALTSDAAAHNARVLAYFSAAGLPSEQIAGVQAHATMHQALDPTKPQPDYTSKPVFDWYSSVISRQIEGVKVLGSFAWARFNVDEEVVSEGSYWPEVPVEVLERAHAFQDVVAAGGFQAKLPQSFASQSGEVVIHHTPGDLPLELKFVVAYDVERSLDHGMSRAIHFDESGKELVLEHETSPGGGSARN
jgi:hypothetical protein